MDCRNGFCTAEADRCLLRTLPRKPQVPYAAGPWAGKTAFEIPILHADLLDAAFWQGHKERIKAGHVHDVFPYEPAKRFRARRNKM